MQFANVISSPGPDLQRRLVESSDPEDLRVRLQAVLLELDSIGPTPVFLASVNLSGAGDGDKWVVEVVAAPAANLQTLDGTTPPGALVLARIDPGLRVICYKAADVAELAVQRDRALTGLTLAAITLEEMTGAAQGLQHMGLILATLA